MEINKIYKPKKFARFTIVPNAIFRYKDISASATGLYCWLFSHEDKTEMTVQFICGHFKDGKDAINKRLKELIDKGFLVRKELRNGGKFAGYNYYLNDKPIDTTKSHRNGKNRDGKTAAVKPGPVNPQQSNTINTNVITNKRNTKEETNTKSKTPTYNEIVIKAFPHFVELFPIEYKPKGESQKKRWLDCLDKLQRIDKYDLRDVYEVTKSLRNDEFWQTNFLSILKFRNLDKNGIKYIDRFMINQKAKTKPVGFSKVKGIIEYFIYKSAADGTKELGAKTKGGQLFEFHIKQLMHTNEFDELKNYVIKNK
jgi:predicted transcriptional regulator